MTLDEAIQHCWDEAEKNRARANDYSDAHDQENEKACNACAVEHAPLAVWAWLIELRQRRAAEQDSLDAMCSQIKKVIRTESDDGDWYAALLKDGSWLNFHEMNDILRRFIFDSGHAVRSYVDYTGQTVYERR